MDIDIPKHGHWQRRQGEEQRYRVSATFCDIDWSLQRHDPASVSFFDGLRERSPSCASTSHTVDLFDTVQTIRRHDDNSAATSVVRSVSIPTGVIFHQSRCGSTLAANLLAAAVPRKTRVYSEHGVPVAALKACADVSDEEESSCDHGLHVRLIRDVYYVLGRSASSPDDDDADDLEYVFYKSNSGGLYIDKFTSAFPDAPWVYMFRDSHEVMQSHWKVPEADLTAQQQEEEVKCARLYRNPHQPPTTRTVLARVNRQYHELSRTEYCAAHLAGISLAVLQEHHRTGMGRFINYRQMPAIMWESVLTDVFGVTMESSAMVDNMRRLSHVYSKGHQRGRDHETWTSDTLVKKRGLTHNITRAVEQFCPDTYDQLERVARRQTTRRGVHTDAVDE